MIYKYVKIHLYKDFTSNFEIDMQFLDWEIMFEINIEILLVLRQVWNWNALVKIKQNRAEQSWAF